MSYLDMLCPEIGNQINMVVWKAEHKIKMLDVFPEVKGYTMSEDMKEFYSSLLPYQQCLANVIFGRRIITPKYQCCICGRVGIFQHSSTYFTERGYSLCFGCLEDRS